MPKKPQSFAQKGRQRAGSFTLSWMWAMPLRSTDMRSLLAVPPTRVNADAAPSLGLRLELLGGVRRRVLEARGPALAEAAAELHDDPGVLCERQRRWREVHALHLHLELQALDRLSGRDPCQPTGGAARVVVACTAGLALPALLGATETDRRAEADDE